MGTKKLSEFTNGDVLRYQEPSPITMKCPKCGFSEQRIPGLTTIASAVANWILNDHCPLCFIEWIKQRGIPKLIEEKGNKENAD